MNQTIVKSLGALLLSAVFVAPAFAAAPTLTPVKAGQVFESQEQHYRILAPADDYLHVPIKTGIAFGPSGGTNYYDDDPQGDYSLQVFATSDLPADCRGDLKKSVEWVNAHYMNPRAKKLMVTLKEEKRDFQGNAALYTETFLPEVVKKAPANLTNVIQPAYEYANLIFFHGDFLYLLSFADALKGPYYFKDKLTPAVEAKAGQHLEQFAKGFSTKD